jgi:hypothetical protein
MICLRLYVDYQVRWCSGWIHLVHSCFRQADPMMTQVCRAPMHPPPLPTCRWLLCRATRLAQTHASASLTRPLLRHSQRQWIALWQRSTPLSTSSAASKSMVTWWSPCAEGVGAHTANCTASRRQASRSGCGVRSAGHTGGCKEAPAMQHVSTAASGGTRGTMQRRHRQQHQQQEEQVSTGASSVTGAITGVVGVSDGLVPQWWLSLPWLASARRSGSALIPVFNGCRLQEGNAGGGQVNAGQTHLSWAAQRLPGWLRNRPTQ